MSRRGGHRYAPRDPNEWAGPGANWFEDPDAQHALADYSAAMRDRDPNADRPPFSVDDWRTPDAQPTHPAWACQGCDIHPAWADTPDPFPGEPPGRIWEPPPEDPGGYLESYQAPIWGARVDFSGTPDWTANGGWLGQHPSGHCRSGSPNCTGECGG